VKTKIEGKAGSEDEDRREGINTAKDAHKNRGV
jgi:hypothetical protein